MVENYRGYLGFIAVGLLLSTLWVFGWAKSTEEKAAAGYYAPARECEIAVLRAQASAAD